MDWLKRDGRSLGDPSKNPWCGDFMETCIRMALPDEPLLGALGTNPYWARHWLLFGREVQPITGAVLIFSRGSGGHVSRSARTMRISTSLAATNQTLSPSPASPSPASSARAGPQPFHPACCVCQPCSRANFSPPPMKSELENTMLKPAILALIRQVLTVAGTALVAKGYVQASDVEPVVGALLTIGSVIWSVADKRRR